MKKSNRFFGILIMIVAFTIFLPSVSALTISPSTITLNARINSTISTTFTVTNNGNTTVSNIQISQSGITGPQITFSDNLFTLAPSTSKTVTVTATTSKSEKVQKLGGVITATSGAITVSNPFEVNVLSRLAIEKFDVKFGDKDVLNLRNGDSIPTDVEPNMPLELKVRLRNEFPSDVDSDTSKLRNVFFRITINNIDNGGDAELESNDFELSAQSGRGETMYYTVPLDTDEGTYDLEIYAEAKDGDRVIHTDTWNLKLTVNKKSHDVRISNEHLTNSMLYCERQTELVFDLMNIGSSDENEVYVRIENKDLGILIIDGPYSIDANEEATKTMLSKKFTLKLPTQAKEGKYNIDVRSYYISNIISSLKLVPMEIKPCTTTPITPNVPTTPTVPTNTNKTNNATNPTNNGNNGQGQIGNNNYNNNVPVIPQNTGDKAQIYDTNNLNSALGNNGYLILLAFVCIIILLAIFAIVIKFFGKKN